MKPVRHVLTICCVLVATIACGSEESSPTTNPSTGGSAAQGTGGQTNTGGSNGGSGTIGCSTDENCFSGCQGFGDELDALLGDTSQVDESDPPTVVAYDCVQVENARLCDCTVESGGVCWRKKATGQPLDPEDWDVACPDTGGGGQGGAK